MLIRELMQKEVWAMQASWRRVFARRLHRLTGRWVQGTDRDVFRPKMMLKYLTGASAEEAYASAAADTVYVIDDEGKCGELRRCPDGVPPALSEFAEKRAVHVFPEDFAWSAATGPEVWDRVMFTYREWVDDVDTADGEPSE